MGCSGNCCHALRLAAINAYRNAVRDGRVEAERLWDLKNLKVHLSECCHAPTYYREADDRKYLHHCSVCSRETKLEGIGLGMDVRVSADGETILSTPRGFTAFSGEEWDEIFKEG